MSELHADFTLRRGALALAAQLDVRAGETLALVGPNGAGKSTVLHALAGLVPIDRGRIELGGRVLDDGTPRAFVPPEERDVGLVFQDGLLFPHLDVLENVAFGLRSRGRSKSQAREQAAAWLQRVGAGDLAGRRPATLSGGQAQRVALARAAATGPRLLLLDEPLAAVDATGRIELRRELRACLHELPAARVLVAHEALDAFALADRIAVLEAGRLVQAGTADEICRRPRSPYVADLVGLNLFRATARAGTVQLESGGELVVASPLEGAVFAAVHPRAVALFRERPDGSPRNVWRARVAAVEGAGDRLRVQLGGAVRLVAEVTPAASAELGLREGAEVWLAVKATEVEVYSG